MSIAPGTRIGGYEVIAAIGAGGMGEVYRARDTRLNRDVALKILPAAFASDLERLARFEREAQVLASLNHQCIAAIHGIEESDGVRALVLEFVDGETLADRIARGPISLDEALPIARQIAEALEAAHEQGIIHRDLKPANIKLRADGTVKVLDFGLAKLVGPSTVGRDVGSGRNVRTQPELTASPTITSPALMTGVGMLLGTAAYMSPEQAKGREADKRSDIWAFGCVLYEMLTGKRTFAGDDTAEVFASALRDEPDWNALPASTPPSVRRFMRRALTKDRKNRLADASSARLELVDGIGEPPTVASSGGLSRGQHLVWASAVALVALAAAALIIGLRNPATLPPPEVRLEASTPPTIDPVSLAISPDGQTLAFVATAEGRSQLWLRPLGSAESRAVPRTLGASFPFWSPDARSIGFFADGSLKRVDVDTGLVQVLTGAPEGRGGTWNRDGRILFAPNAASAIFSVSAAGGPAIAVTRVDGAKAVGHRSPHFLPDGRHFLYYVVGGSEYRTVYVGSIASGESGSAQAILTGADAGPVYSPSGYLLYVRQGALLAQPFDAARLALAGEPVPLAQQVATGPNMAAVSVSANGVIAFRPGEALGRRQFTWFDRAGKQLQRIGDSGFFADPTVARDGRLLAFRREVDGDGAVWLMDIDTGRLTKFTSGRSSFPVWSPDGSRIVFSADADKTGVNDLWIKPVTGAGREEVLLVTPQIKAGVDWSPDGRYVLFRMVVVRTGNDLFAMSLEDRKFFAVAQGAAEERDAQFSPDGKWIAFVSNESGRPEIYVQRFPGTGPKQSISSNGGGQPRWRRDGRELFYLSLNQQMMAVQIDTSKTEAAVAAAPVPLFTVNVGGAVQRNSRQQYVVSPDGQRFLMNMVVEEAATPINVILNWRPKT